MAVVGGQGAGARLGWTRNRWVEMRVWFPIVMLSCNDSGFLLPNSVFWYRPLRCCNETMKVIADLAKCNSNLSPCLSLKPCPHWRLQSPNSATFTENGDCRRIQRQSPFCIRIRRQIVTVSGDYSRRIRRL